MAHSVRPATVNEIPRLVEVLLMDAEERQAEDPELWKIATDAASKIEQALTFALTAKTQPFQQFWHVAEASGTITGVAHAMMLPVPPIYAGAKGEPGLILPDCFAAPDAPEGTVRALVEAAEGVLRQAGAQIIVSSFVTGDPWRRAFQESGYQPLTLYFSRSGFGDADMPSNVRPATEADVLGIVARSAENRQVLFEIDPFWEAHPEADPRFMNWMKRSLTLTDRDMMVTGTAEALGRLCDRTARLEAPFPARA